MSSVPSATFALSSLKLPDIHTEDTKTSPVFAVHAIQKLYRNFKSRLALNDKVSHSVDNLKIVLNSLDMLKDSHSFEKSQRDLFGEKFNKALNAVVELLPHAHSIHTSSKAIQAFRMKSKRAIASALLISKHPRQILYAEESSAEDQSIITKNCLHYAKLVTKSIRKFINLSNGDKESLKGLEHSLHSLGFAVHLFSVTFSKWQVEDRFRMMKSLEDSFIEGYTAFIASKASVLFQNADPSLLHSAEQHIAKLKEVMFEMIGASAKHRIEELCAAVEASMPVYQQMRSYEDSLKRTPTPVVASAPSSATKASRSTPTATPERITTNTSSATTPSSTVTSSPSSSSATRQSPQAVQQPSLFPSIHQQSSNEPITLGDGANEPTASRYLERLSKMTGLTPYQLVHEMTLDPFYRLPAERPTLEGAASGGVAVTRTGPGAAAAASPTAATADSSPATVALLLRQQILSSMADKMVSGLRDSNVRDITDLAVGMIVPLRFAPNTYKYSEQSVDELFSDVLTVSDGSQSSVKSAESPDPPVYSARITAIHYSSLSSKLHEIDVDVNHGKLSTDGPALATATASDETNEHFAVTPHSESDIHSHSVAVQHATSVLHHPEHVDSTLHGALNVPFKKEKNLLSNLHKHNHEHSFHTHNDITIDVEYVHEANFKEEKVDIGRVKLTSHRLDAAPFLTALSDLCHQIASFTPNRHDLIADIFTHVDFALLRQMIETKSINPAQDLLPVFAYLQRALLDLQAPSRAASTQQWIGEVKSSFYEVDSVGIGGVENKSDETLKSRSFQDVLPQLPLFFERASDVIDEIQRDMANFYISTLVPIATAHGASYLSRSFVRLLQQGGATLDATASLLLGQINSANALRGTMLDIAEAGACCVTNGFTLHDLMTNAVTAPAPPAVVESSSSSSSSAAKSVTFTRKQLCRAVVARSFLSLLQLPFRLDSRQAAQLRILPETLTFDAARLSAARDLVDRIALESSIVITSRQLLSRYQVTFKDSEEVELQHRLDVLLTEKDVNFASISTEVVQYVKYAIYRHREAHRGGFKLSGSGSSSVAAHSEPRGLLSPVTASLVGNYDLKELQERVERTVREVIAPGNAVLTLFTKRVYKILLRVMLGQPYAEKLQSYSLQSRGQERNLTQCIDSVVRLFTLSWNVHGELYAAMIGTYADSAITSGVSVI